MKGRGRILARRAIGTAALFVAGAVVGVALHSGTPALRRLAIARANRALADAFQGAVEITGARRLGLDGVDDANVVVRDPQGRVVAVADGVTIRIGLPALAWAVLRGKGDIAVAVSEARARRIDVTLVRDLHGEPTLAHAFDPRHPGPRGGPSRGVRIDVKSLRIAALRAHGQVASFEDIDAGVTGLAASFEHDEKGTAAAVDGLELNVRGVLPDAITAHVTALANLPATGTRRASASIDGNAGAVPVSLRAVMVGSKMDAAARAIAGGGTVDAVAVAEWGQVTTAEVTVSVTGVDPHRVIASAPQTDVHASAHVHARVEPGGAVTGDVTVHTEPTRVLSQTLPSLDAEARFTRTRVTGAAHIAEPGAPVDLRFEARRADRSNTIDFDAGALAPDLAVVPLLRARKTRGSAEVRATGHVDLDGRAVDAVFQGHASSVRIGTQTVVKTAVVRGRVQGPLEALTGSVALDARGVEAAGQRIDTISVHAKGPILKPEVTAALRGSSVPAVDAHATLAFSGGFTAEGAVLRLARNQTTVTTRAALLRAGDGRIDVVGLQIDGLGSPIHGDIHANPQAVAARVVAPGVSVPMLMRLLGKSAEGHGQLALDVDVRTDGRGATGHVDSTLGATGMFGMQRSDARLDLKLDGHRVDGSVHLAFDGAQATATLADVVLDGPPGAEKAWRRATGAVDLSSSVDLAVLRRLLKDKVTALERMSGRMSLRMHVARAHRDGVPDATVTLSTQDLALVVRPQQPGHVHRPEEPKPGPGFHTSGLDVGFAASLEGGSDHVTFDGVLFDPRGPVLKLQVDATPPVAQLLLARGGVTALLEHTALRAHAELPQRDLAELPPVLRPPAVRGLLQATVDVSGQVADPRVKLIARGVGVTLMQASSRTAFDGSVDATYDGRAAIARVLARRAEGIVLDVRADIDAPIAQLLSRSPRGQNWDAGATVALHGFPVDAIPQIATHGVGGRASGVVTIEGLHRDARIDADIKLEKPRLGGECFQDGFARLQIERSRLVASTRFERPGSFATATVNASSRWGADLIPTLDPLQPMDATLEARDFRAGALLPFVRGAVDQLDGRLDGHVRMHVNPDRESGQFQGDLTLSDGVVEIPALGQPLHGVGARVTMGPWGTLRIDDITASGATGRLTGAARALFDGARFRSATADLDIPLDKRMPATLEGVAFGEVSGHVHADAAMAPDQRTLDIEIEVPRAQVELPRGAGRSVQSLDPAPGILVGAREPRTGRFVALPQHAPEKPRVPTALGVRAVVKLGSEVRIRRDQNLDVELTGEPVLEITDKTRMTGTVHITRGTAEVFGKRFALERSSTVAFTGDTDSPQLAVTAMYEAPDHTRIFADIGGTPQKLKANLRSEPPLKQDEIVGLLLFGSPEGLGGTPAPGAQPDPTQRAAGLAGGVVTQGINQALSGITHVEISTSLDTTRAANPRPEVDVRLTNDVTARVTVQTGMPAPGEPPDRTLVTVDWRLKPRWSLQSTVGDQGSTLLDLLWRHRY